VGQDSAIASLDEVIPEGYLSTLIEFSEDLVCIASLDGFFKWLNPQWCTVLGWSRAELMRRPFIEFVHPADVESTFEQIERLSTGIPINRFENRYRCKDGGWRWLSWTVTPGDAELLFCMVRDVNDRHVEQREQQTRLRQLELAESLAKIGNWRLDLSRNTVYWSPEVYRIHGRDPRTYLPELSSGIDAYHPDDQDEVRRCIGEAIESRSTFHFKLRLIRANDNAERIVLSSGLVQVDEEGDPYELIGVFQDITDITRAEQELRRANDDLERRMGELETRSDMMGWISELGDMLQSALDLDESREVLQALLPRIFSGLSGVVYLRDDERGGQRKIVAWGPLEGPWRNTEPDTCWAVRRGTVHEVPADGTLRCRHLPGVPAGSRCAPLMAHGQLVGLLVLASNTPKDHRLEMLGSLSAMVAEQIALAVSNLRLRDRLRQQSLRDQLTGLYNRRFFDDWLSKQLYQAKRQGSTVGIAILDLDHFKRFNDTFGHLAADRLLVKFSEVLQQSIRAEDVVCRWGGEEFVLAMPSAGEDGVPIIVARIQEALANIEMRDDNGVRVSPPTLSAGISCYPIHARKHEALLHIADKALYTAKSAGRNRAVIAPLPKKSEDSEQAA